MALQKQPIQINFAQGLDTKSDPKQVPIGKFSILRNSVFTKAGLLQKRNGYSKLTSLPDVTSTYATTFNGNLTAIGSNIEAYSGGSQTWVDKGALQPILVDTLPLIRSNTNQSQVDTAVASNGLVCTVYTDQNPASLGSAQYKYAVADSVTGQNIVAPAVITPSSGTVTGAPRVFTLGKYFVIVFTVTISAANHLQYIAINTTVPTSVSAAADISTSYIAASTVAFDGVVANNSLYLAWNGADGGNAIRMTYIDSTLIQHNTVTFAGRLATIMSVTADNTGSTPVIYASFYDLASTSGYVLAVSSTLVTILSPTQWVSTGTILNVTSSAQSGVNTIYYEVSTAYSYDSAIKTNIVKSRTVTQAGTLGTAATVVRSVGLASKSFIVGTTEYFLGIYSSASQPTYFLLNSSGQVVAKLAYSNGGVYYITGLPSVMVSDTVAQFGFFFKDLVESVNKTVGTTVSASVYTQTGINLATITIGTSDISTTEAAKDLHLSGGFLWMYDGYVAVEHGFHLYPDYVEATWSATGGSIVAKPDGATNTNAYYYQAVYEWCDNQGNIFRSAPSIPIGVTTTGSGTAGSITVNIPTLRLTYKTSNPVKIVLYRWSVANQVFYQVTSVTSPTINSTTTDSVAIVDTLADASIIGNSIIYTNGGVIENIGAPACSDLSLFKNTLILIDAEDKNLLWTSKPILEATPVELSDLLTFFVSATSVGQESAGVMKYTTQMDDKLIIAKEKGFCYLSGDGPDATGANSTLSEPVFITSSVGSTNKKSIVLIPQGLMFQAASGKGIWLLGRDLSTQYIGAPVEDFNEFDVQSAVSVPGTNQVRFTLSNGVTLMYDYYFQQWGTFTGVSAVSSTIYQGLHTFINSRGEVYQETPGLYLDGANPVLMSFKTGPINVAGLQGFERAYWFYLLGTYISPHKLTVTVFYDYSQNPEQSSVVTPENYNPSYGGDPVYGSGNYGGTATLEQWQVYFQKQKCEAFQVAIQESYDSTFGVPAGAGLTLSGLNLVVGVKGGTPKLKASVSVG